MKKIIIPQSFLKLKNGKFSFEKDENLKNKLKEILLEKDTEFVFNIEGTTKSGKKLTKLSLDSIFFSVFPSSGTFTINVSNCFEVNTEKNWQWPINNIDKLEFNFKNIDYNYFKILPESAESKGKIKNLVLNLNETHSAITLYSNSIDNLKITQNHIDTKYGQEIITGPDGIDRVIVSKTPDNIVYTNHLVFENLSKTKTIDLSGFHNIQDSQLQIGNVNKICNWTLKSNLAVAEVQETKTIEGHPIIEVELMKKQSKSSKFTTEQLKNPKLLVPPLSH